MGSSLVYRVEHSQIREGPFVNSWRARKEVQKVLEYLSGRDVKYPHPYLDFSIKRNGGIPYCMKFGCASIEQLKLWFAEPSDIMEVSSFLTGMSEEGFVLAVYKVPSQELQVGKSGTQVMYDYTEAELVKDMSLLELLN